MTETANKLTGITVLVTRPEHQAEGFCQLVEQAGGKVIRFPVIAIREIKVDSATLQQLQRAPDKLIFISANAVRLGIPMLQQHAPNCLTHSELAAIGEATAAKMQAMGYPPKIMPLSPFNSEALLAIPIMQNVAGQRIAIIKGKGGRTYLQEQLAHRGAIVIEADNYERVKPSISNEALSEFMRSEKPIAAVTSVKGLHYLFEMASEAQQVFLREQVTFLVPGERVAEAVKDLHIKQAAIIAENATDEIMMEALCAV